MNYKSPVAFWPVPGDEIMPEEVRGPAADGGRSSAFFSKTLYMKKSRNMLLLCIVRRSIAMPKECRRLAKTGTAYLPCL